MELIDAIERRRSVRRYNYERKVPREHIDEILKAAAEAPSAGGLRAYKVIVSGNIPVYCYGSPTVILVCALPEVSATKYGERGRKLYAIQDATIFAAYIQLLALEYDLSTCWIGAFRESKVRQMFGLSEDMLPVVLIAIGYEEVKGA